MSFIPSSNPETQFDELVVSEKTHIIELKSVYGVNYTRDTVSKIGIWKHESAAKSF